MATFVLVHGAFHGGWCYSRVLDRLRKLNHDAYAPTLSGVGEQSHLAARAINLSTHVQDVVREIEAHDLNNVILCGHSYGGMVITAVASQLGGRIRTLFYLDACVPKDGQSLFDIVGPERALASLQAAGETGIMMAPFSAALFQVNPNDVEWVDRMCTPHPISCFIEKLRLTGREAEVANRTYVLAARHQSYNHQTYRSVKDQAGWKMAAIDCGHDVMIDEPSALVSLLLAEVDRTDTAPGQRS